MRKLRDLSADAIETMKVEAAEIARLPIYFDERPALTIRQIRMAGRKFVRRYGCRLLMLDYLQLGRADYKMHSRYEEVTEISAGVKAMAKELDVPVILLSQLNRASVIGNRRPTPADLRESGAVEQDADLIAFINGNLTEDELPEVWRGKFTPDELGKLVQFDIQKQREGERITAFLRFVPEFTRFENPIVPSMEPEWVRSEDQ
jgi:replicative DNA helicase